MSKLFLLVPILFLFSCKNKVAQNSIEEKKREESYYIGLQMAYGLKNVKTPVDTKEVLRGLKDGLNSEKDIPSEVEVHQYLQKTFQTHMGEKTAEISLREEETHKFMDENGKKKDIVKVSDFLQYQVNKTGAGAVPGLQDHVVFNVRGQLLNDSVFMDTFKSKKPMDKTVIELIPGWRTLIQTMKPGEKRTMWVAPEMAYGARGTDGVPPGSLVKFELELLSVKKAAK